MARGRYILFVDADDWLESGIINKLMERLAQTGADIITSGWYIHDGESQILETGYMEEGTYRKGVNKNYFASHMIYCDGTKNNGINGSLNTKIARKDLFEKAFSSFPQKIVYAEDDFMTYACLAMADCVEVTHMPLYHYVMNYDSISHNRIDSFLSDLGKGYAFFKNVIQDNPDYLIYKKQIEIYIQRALYLGLQKYMGFDDKSVVSWYRFETDEIQDGAAVIIYGAGKVGKSYYRQLRREKKYTVTAWVDKEFAIYQREGYPVEAPAIIKGKSEWIIIAVDSEVMAKVISEQIITEYKVNPERIYWKKPVNLLDDILEDNLQEYV